jgi:hypothetical protein
MVYQAGPNGAGTRMTPPTDPGFPVYGLASNPFLLAELDPITRPADLKNISLVDGWQDLSDAKGLIRRRVADAKPIYFVIVGASQTGRSSIANYLVYLWATEHGIGPESNRKLLVHRRSLGANNGSYAADEQVLDWISQFYLRVLTEEDFTLSTTAQKRVESLSLSQEGMTLSTRFALALKAVETDLLSEPDRPTIFAAIFEHGKGRGLVQMIQDSFAPTRSIIILTVDATTDAGDVLDGIDKVLLPDAGLLLRLGPVQGTDIGTITSDRWNLHRPGVESPFETADVAMAFDQPRPIARAVKLLSKMLRLQQMYFKDHAPWPDDKRLALNALTIRELLEVIDGEMDLGGIT